MTEQLDLGVAQKVAQEIAAPKPLTPRQQQAFDYVRERDGVTADEVGAWLHAHRDKRPHSVDERCEWCARDGLSVLRSKRLSPLVRYRLDPQHGRLYIAREPGRNGPRKPSRGLIATSDPNPETNPWADL